VKGGGWGEGGLLVYFPFFMVFPAERPGVCRGETFMEKKLTLASAQKKYLPRGTHSSPHFGPLSSTRQTNPICEVRATVVFLD